MAEPDYSAEFMAKFGGSMSAKDAQDMGLPPPVHAAPAGAQPTIAQEQAATPSAVPGVPSDIYQDPKTGLRYRRVGANYELIEPPASDDTQSATPGAAQPAGPPNEAALQAEFAKKFGVDLKNVDKEPPPDPTEIDPKTGVPYAMSAHPWAAHVNNFVGAVIDALPAGHYLRQALDYAALGDQAPQMQQAEGAMAAEHPIEHAFGTGTGVIGGAAALGVAAPELFGGGALAKAPMAIRAGVSALANGSLGALDAVANGEDPKSAAILGSILGGFGPGIGDAIERAMQSKIIPYTTQLASDAIDRFKIPIKAYQDGVVNNPLIKTVRGFEQMMPLSKNAAADASKSMNAWYKAIADNTMDPKAASAMDAGMPRITRDILNMSDKNTSALYESTLGRAPPLQFDAPFAQYWARATGELSDPIYHSMDAPSLATVNGLFDKVIDGFRQGRGELQPEMLQSMLKKDNWLDKAVDSPKEEVSKWAGELKDKLRGLFERQAPPDVLKDWRTANQRWRANRILEDAIGKDHAGNFTPEKFYQAVEKHTPDFATSGGGTIGRLAEIGTSFLKSETNRPADMRAVLHAVGSGTRSLAEVALAGGAGFHALGPYGLALAAAPIAAGRIAGWALRRPGVAKSAVRSALGQGPERAGNALTRYLFGEDRAGDVLPRALLGGPRGVVSRGGWPALVQSAQPVARNYLSPPMPAGAEASQ